MLKLIIWTHANQAMISKYVTPVLRKLGVGHQIHPITGRLPQLKPGDVCVGMGQKAVEVLQQVELVPKNRKVGSLRGNEIKLKGGRVSLFLTFDPGFIEMDYARKPDLEWDITLAYRKLATGSLDPVIGNYRYVNDFCDVIEEIKARYAKTNKPVPIACDLETVGLDPWADNAFIVSIQISYKPGQADVIRFVSAKSPRQPAIWLTKHEPDIHKQEHDIKNEFLLDQITWLLNSKKVAVRGANFKFDQTWMGTHWGIEYFDAFRMDTLLCGSLVDENRSNSLNTHTKIYVPLSGGYDDNFNDTYDKSRMDLVPDEPLLVYSGGDADFGLQTSNAIRNILIKDKKLTRFYLKLQHPAAQAFRIMEQRGMYVDREKYLELQEECQAELDRANQDVLDLMPTKLKIKYRDDLRITRPKIIRDYLFSKRGLNLRPLEFTEKTQEPKISGEHYDQLLKKHNRNSDLRVFVESMSAYTGAKKTMDTYIVGFMKHIRSDGKFHPTHLLHRGEFDGDGTDAGAKTGRLSARFPAVQTLPKRTKWAKRLRSVYVAPPGHVVMNCDFAQGELKVIACISNEHTMIDAYKKGIDLHALSASQVMGISLKDFMKQPDDIRAVRRTSGKAINFGMIYLISPEGFMTYARTSYGVTISLKEARDYQDGFFNLYPRIKEYHKTIIKFANRNGYVRSPLGRVRHLPLINSRDYSVKSSNERMAVNAPVQSTLSDLALMAMSLLSQRYPELYIMGFTHDALTFYIPEDEIELWARRIRDVMENLPLKEMFGWSPQLQFTIDIEVGQNHLADMVEYKLDR